MAALLTSKIKHLAQKSFLDALKSGSTPVFFYFGKSDAWNSSDEIIPALDNNKTSLEVGDDIIMAKMANLNNISVCAKRVDWESGRVYNSYSNVYNMDYVDSYYVLTDEMNVYKCLGNNNYAPSSVKPVSTSLTPFETSDGYIWKYMLSLGPREAKLFLTNHLMPVNLYPNNTSSQYKVQMAAIDGTIDSYTPVNQGVNYTTASVEIIGDGTGAKAIPVIKNGQIMAIKQTSRGSGYTRAVAKISGNGSGAEFIPEISPVGGHGSNPVEELSAGFVMMTCTVGDEDDKNQWNNIPKNFEFRKIGVITNLTEKQTGSQVSENLVAFCHKFEVNTVDDLLPGAKIVFNTNHTGVIVSTESTEDNKRFVYINAVDKSANVYDMSSFNAVNNYESGYIIKDVAFIPGVNLNKLELLYLESLDRITRVENQIDLIRVVVEF